MKSGLSVVQTASGRSELQRIQNRSRGLLAAAILFSIFVNILMLTGPLYMLQVYDRVLGSRSEATLVALSVLVVMLFLIMGILDHARQRILARVGARLQAHLDRRVFEAAMSRAATAPDDPLARSAQRDLQSMQRYWSSQISAALIDMPWTPIFIAAIFVFHPMLGWLAVSGGTVLVALALINQQVGKGPSLRASAAAISAERMADRLKTDAELVRALGMTNFVFRRWVSSRNEALATGLESADMAGAFSTTIHTLRLFLQSAILGLGAWLVLQGEMTAGAMIAGSIIMGRALAPVEKAIGQWSVLTRAREGRENLVQLLSLEAPLRQPSQLPRPRARLDVEGVTIVLPETGGAVLRNVSFRMEPGQALGIIGPSGAGKSTLGRVIVGAMRPSAGKIRLDSAELEQYGPEQLSNLIGYLPQTVTLFDATVGENIARMSPTPDFEKVVAAARAAGAHEMILKLPKGYDARISSLGGLLSGGQIQRIGLARALYGDPVILVLDEPNSNLDNAGSLALNAAVRKVKAEGGSVIVIAHRPAAIQECDLLLMLENGQRAAFGPRDEVLRSIVKNHTEIVRASGSGAVS